MRDLDMRVAGGVIISVGIALTGIHAVHGVAEVTDAPGAVVTGVLIPLLISLLLVIGGCWVISQSWSEVTAWRLLIWVLGGLVVGVALSVLLSLYQMTEGVVLSDQFYVLGMFATYGSAIGLLVGWYDMNNRQQFERERRKTERLDTFATVVSHDLRNPLNVASGHLGLVSEECDSNHVVAIQNAHDRMEELIEDLLAFAREGEAVTETSLVSIAELTERCWQTVDTEEASLQVEATGEVHADKSRLEQVFENLFRNAIDHGGESVTITVGDLPNGRGFFVRDTGPGIPVSEREKVFEAGYSTEESGIGFGLSIVREIVEAHGWEIQITDAPGGGAQFEIITR
jgi:signal transduction histidine kinase